MEPGNSSRDADPTSRDLLRLGTILNGIYRIDRRLGVGGMGEVYEGVNIENGEREAIKVIAPAVAQEPMVEQLFRREAKVLRSLSSPEIAQLRLFARDPALDLLYLVTEFVDGPSLGSLLAGTPAPERDVIALLRRVGQGLRVAHDLNLVHRDISPDNILLPGGRVENAKIIDFGIAKDINVGAHTIIGDGFAGKLGYSAPEMFSAGANRVGPWSDVYSLGLVAAAFALGRPIDMGRGSFAAAYEARLRPVDLSGVPATLRPLLARMLEQDSGARMQGMAEMLGWLDGLDGARAAAATMIIDPAPPHRPPMPVHAVASAGDAGSPPLPGRGANATPKAGAKAASVTPPPPGFPMLWLIVVLVAVIAGLAFYILYTSLPPAPSAAAPSSAVIAGKGTGCTNKTASGLGWSEIRPGSGPTPTDKDIALINYKGTLADGRQFDAAQSVPLPLDGVVPGFAEGLKLMRKGGSYRLCIPPALGYGAEAIGPIPANSELFFDIDMLDFKSKAEIEGAIKSGKAPPPTIEQPTPWSGGP